MRWQNSGKNLILLNQNESLKKNTKHKNSLFWTQNNLFTKVNKHKIESAKEEKKKETFENERDKKRQ